MIRISPVIVLAAVAGLCAAPVLHAQSLDTQRPAIRDALAAAEAGRVDAASASLARHPLYGWVEFAALRRDPDAISTAQAQAFLARYDGQAVAGQFRSLWLAALARRQDWPTFLAAWKPTDSVALQCAHLQARQATGRTDAAWTEQAQSIWRKGAKSLPDGCDRVFDVLASQGGLTPAIRWERIEAAATERQTGVMRSAARGLPADEAALASDYAAFIDAVNPRALNWPRTERSRRMAVHGLARLAQNDPDAAERALPQYADALGMGERERGQVLYQIALWTVASYAPDSARRLGNVPKLLEKAVLPLSLVPSLDEERLATGGSLYGFLAERYGFTDDFVEQVFEVDHPNSLEREHLKLTAKDNVVRIRGVSVNAEGTAFDSFQQTYPAREFLFYVSGTSGRRLVEPARTGPWSVRPFGSGPTTGE